MQLQHQGNSYRNGAIKHIFYTNQIHGGIISRLPLFILSLHALALHLAVKILLQIFLYEDLSTLALHANLSAVLQNASSAGPHFVTQPILLSETFLIFDINHQQKHKEVRPQIETIKR